MTCSNRSFVMVLQAENNLVEGARLIVIPRAGSTVSIHLERRFYEVTLLEKDLAGFQRLPEPNRDRRFEVAESEPVLAHETLRIRDPVIISQKLL